ncbi:MAG: hypothetical protein DME08_15625 [Candidatus Rokuibacteriota bacterium]|nr:MAG: hypothetical protein DME08_15625 [Candidatus Rokubacteria bacterium]
MLDSLIDTLPDSWHDVAEMASLPIAWIPKLQHTLVPFFFESASPWAAAAKCVFLLFPLLLALAGIWCTQLSIYTLPFRASRTRFGSLLLLAWWDAGRVVWMYWVGIVRLSGVAVGWALAMSYLGVRLLAGFLRETITVIPGYLLTRPDGVPTLTSEAEADTDAAALAAAVVDESVDEEPVAEPAEEPKPRLTMTDIHAHIKGPRPALRDVLRGDVLLPRGRPGPHALARRAGEDHAQHVHDVGPGGGRLDQRPCRHLVPLRPVWNADAAGFHRARAGGRAGIRCSGPARIAGAVAAGPRGLPA